MKKTLKKSTSWLLVLATLFSLCAAMSVGVSAATVSLGKAGNDIEAYYDTETQILLPVKAPPGDDQNMLFVQQTHRKILRIFEEFG